MFDNLNTQIEKALKTLKGHGKITEVNISSTLKKVLTALVEADVQYALAKKFVTTVKEKAIGEQVLSSLHPGQVLVKIVKEELTHIMGDKTAEINLSDKLTIILVCGLQGSGKTTFSAKLAAYLKNRKNKKPLLVACDVYRPAAILQLETLGTQISVPVFKLAQHNNPIDIAASAINVAKSQGKDTLIIDTAGRLTVDERMMVEIEQLYHKCHPSETLFVVDAMTGQDAVQTAKVFADRINFDGVVLTKLDGDTRGGCAISIKSTVKKPIKFIGTGEKLDALDIFHPDRMASRILGMGDVLSLVERAEQQYDKEVAKKVAKRMAKNQFGYDDFLNQIEQIKKIGGAQNIINMLPGKAKPSNMQQENFDEAFEGFKHIIQSMTEKEKRNPHLLNFSRKNRIAKGSGKTLNEVNSLVKKFNTLSKMMRMLNQGKKTNILRSLGMNLP